MMPRSSPPIKRRSRKPPLRVAEILNWADDFHARRGRWPHLDDGPVEGTADENWGAIDRALTVGNRGLSGGTTLAKFLLRRRGRRHWHLPSDLRVNQIVEWADAHHRTTGEWPGTHCSGPIPGAPIGTTWVSIDLALKRGKRGMVGGRSLARVLELHRGVRNRLNVTELTEEDILTWAEDHRVRTGTWPKYQDGNIATAPRETWHAIDSALWKGSRGLRGGDSLAKLLARCRGVRNKSDLPALTIAQIREWIDLYRRRAEMYPTKDSGPIPEAPGETWSGVNAALIAGTRGLPGGDSLPRVLARQFGQRNLAAIPNFTIEAIQGWIVAHQESTGDWPKAISGAIAGAPGETWSAVDNALRRGRRGLTGGSSVTKLVRAYREASPSQNADPRTCEIRGCPTSTDPEEEGTASGHPQS